MGVQIGKYYITLYMVLNNTYLRSHKSRDL